MAARHVYDPWVKRLEAAYDIRTIQLLPGYKD